MLRIVNNEKYLINSYVLWFRSYLVETDWTQAPKKEGTFVLETGSAEAGRLSPASIRTSAAAAQLRPASTRSHGCVLVETLRVLSVGASYVTQADTSVFVP